MTARQVQTEKAPAPSRSRFGGLNWRRMMTICRTDLRQLRQARDFWGPMVAIGVLFFLVIPLVLLLCIRLIGSAPTVANIARTLDILPEGAQAKLRGGTPGARTSFALAVYLLAPVAVVVPLTISSAIGAATIVGERERGTGEFLAHSPAGTSEIYLGKLLASLLPGYATVFVGFGLYSLLVNVIVGPQVGGWFFPTKEWWVLVTWVIPPFLALGLSIVLRLSAKVKSTMAAQQASGLISLPLILISYTQTTGALFGSGVGVGLAVGTVAWAVAIFSLWRGVRSMSRSRLLGVANEM